MIEKLRFWLEFEVLYYFKVAFLVIIGKLDAEMLADMYGTKIIYNDIYEKQLMREAIKKKDYKEIERLASSMNIKAERDEAMYDEFLNKVMLYIVMIILIIFVLAALLVLLLGRI